jgi:hypothetical protein
MSHYARRVVDEDRKQFVSISEDYVLSDLRCAAVLPTSFASVIVAQDKTTDCGVSH